MWDEDGKINRAGPVVMRIGDGTHLKVVDDICDEEDHRCDQSAHHIFLVYLFIALFNLYISE